jgi:hypothetical protein
MLDDIDASHVEHYLRSGRHLSNRGQFADAERCARAVIQLRPNHAVAHNDLGYAQQMQGDSDAAVAAYRKALQLDPNLRLARRNLALLLARLGQRDESLLLCHAELRTGSEGLHWLRDVVSTAMAAHDLSFAGEMAWIVATLRLGSAWHPRGRDQALEPFPIMEPEHRLTIPKLQHDIEQFLYLQEQGLFGAELTPIIEDYRRVIESLASRVQVSEPLEGKNKQAIGHVYNRIIHVRHTPRLRRALSDAWDATAVENKYLSFAPGVVVVDDFLSSEALREVRQFCLESTVWSTNRYAHGRLGAFFHDGFNCPLLLQIAEELRAAMPRVIGDSHPLKQLWGFKNSHQLPGDSTTHADFAAVNVNFWITPHDANLDDSTGGLVIYNVDAPLHWDFATYNGRSDIIKPFLVRQQAAAVTIPYRSNRAVIFNSDLFHGTAEVKFRPGYENRRINVTMLYGVREDDHRHFARPDPMTNPRAGAWRSAAFARARRQQ